MTVLVVSTVHSADDTRIRERLVRTLSQGFEVRYATRLPRPTDTEGMTWVPLRGSRLRRWLRALQLLLGSGWDVAVVHDPELIPAAVVARAWRRKPIVFDVHEDLVAQIVAKEWIPAILRGPFRGLARLLYRLAESLLVLSLAEDGYRRLFVRDHPVFPNFPTYRNWPEPVPEGDGRVVYVGDVSAARGVTDAAEATARTGLPFLLVGPVPEALRADLAGIETLGRLPNPEALRVAASAGIGISPLRDLPNYRHSLPTKVIEYLALGLPVVATDLPGTRAVTEGWEAVWLVPPGDTEAMAEALREASRPEARVSARTRAADVRARFVWPDTEILSWYRTLAEKPPAPGEVHSGQGRGNGERGEAGPADGRRSAE